MRYNDWIRTHKLGLYRGNICIHDGESDECVSYTPPIFNEYITLKSTFWFYRSFSKLWINVTSREPGITLGYAYGMNTFTTCDISNVPSNYHTLFVFVDF